MSQQKSLVEFTNWLSFTHDEYLAAMHMGKHNYDSMQLAAKWWGFYLERKYLEDQKHIIFFMAAMFRLADKYILRGGIGHMASKGNENVEALLQTATKIESISFQGMKQPNIKFISPNNIRAESWENQFEALAVNIMLHPEEYPHGFEIHEEKSYSSPLSLTALKVYLRTIETAISYEQKRKVISEMEKTQDSINTYIAEFDERTKEIFKIAATNVNDLEKKVLDMQKQTDEYIESTKGSINLVLKKQVIGLEKVIKKVQCLSAGVDLLEQELGEKKIFQGFIGRRNLKKLFKAIEG